MKRIAPVLLAVVLACAAIPVRAEVDLVSQAERFLGTNPTGWVRNWCAYGLNRFVLAPLGFRQGTANAGSFLAFPRTAPHRGALVVQGRRGRAVHVGIVESVSARGVGIISFNWGHRVARGVLSSSQVLAFVEPVAGRGSVAGYASAVPWPINGHRYRWHRHRRRHHHRRHA